MYCLCRTNGSRGRWQLDPLLEEAEKVLESLARQLAIEGGLYSHQRLLRQAGFRVKGLAAYWSSLH